VIIPGDDSPMSIRLMVITMAAALLAALLLLL